MDQNTPRDDTGAQPPADATGADGSAWNQAEQPVNDQTQTGQPAPDSGQPAATEYAAWSSDTAYQQQQAAAPAEGAAAYSAPEPQSATYSDPAAAAPADQQAYAQQPAYDQQQAAYAQQQQQAYDQQQAAYAQQQQQQPYDQQAYAQQQQQAYQQQYPQQGYDQQGYQQPGSYDQQAYQQQYPQGYQQPGQPYTYAQPGAQPWPEQEQYWEDAGSGYGRSFLAVLAGFVLLTWGLMQALGGGLVLWLGNLADLTADLTLSADAQTLVTEFDKQATAFGGILMIIGLMHLIGAVGVWAHRKWGRAFGIVLGLLGTLWGIGILISAVGFETLDVGFDRALTGEEASVAAGVLVLATYLLVLVAMFVGRRHFRRKGVS